MAAGGVEMSEVFVPFVSTALLECGVKAAALHTALASWASIGRYG